jgi:hypothetical protein
LSVDRDPESVPSGSSSLLVANPINRYLINSPMLPQLKQDADGGVTLLIQNESPGKDNEANWLPAPKEAFRMYLRLYWPKANALDESGKPQRWSDCRTRPNLAHPNSRPHV